MNAVETLFQKLVFNHMDHDMVLDRVDCIDGATGEVEEEFKTICFTTKDEKFSLHFTTWGGKLEQEVVVFPEYDDEDADYEVVKPAKAVKMLQKVLGTTL
jgi:hypothetical protein